MSIKPVPHRIAGFCLLAVLSWSALAVETHVWNQSDPADYSRGTVKGLSIRSDGHVRLAPAFRELDSTSVPYLWAIAQDSKGTLYYGGGAPTGATTKVFALAKNGKSKVFAEIAGLEIHALAVDKQDRVYAAVLPDAKIYRLDDKGKSTLFFDPKCKYVWAMSFDKTGNLFVATGDSGLIFKVTPDGKGTKFFDSEETHARSMIIDESGGLLVGTEPSGLILRITPAGKSFVLYQTSKREVTALGERDGVVYAASVGSKTQPAIVSGASPVLPSNTSAVTGAGTIRSGSAPPSLPPSVGSLSAAVVGGSEIVRIEKDGYAERIWNSPTDLVYAIAFDSNGKPLLGTGNRGIIYRLDSDQLSTQLLNIPPTQITAFLSGMDHTLYVATGNVGNLYALSPGLQREGTITSDVLDSHDFTYWGKAHVTPTPMAEFFTFETRSGNVSNPENDWSSWTTVAVPHEGGQVTSPPARFLQYRLTLKASGDRSPEVSSVDIAYQAKNVAPKVTTIEVAPFNYKEAPTAASLERSVLPSGSPTSITLPAVGQRRTLATTNIDVPSTATLNYGKGYVTLRWLASDTNGDPLTFAVEIRAKNSSVWRELKDKTTDHFYSFDSASFPDGEYIPRITASDAGGNIPSEALTGAMEGDAFTIDNTPPEILDLKASAAGSNKRAVSFTAKDSLSWIDKAEYSLNGNDWTLLSPVNRVTDSQTLSYRFEVESGQTVSIRVFDEDDNISVKQIQ